MLWFNKKEEKKPSALAVEERRKNAEALKKELYADSIRVHVDSKPHVMSDDVIFGRFQDTFSGAIRLAILLKLGTSIGRQELEHAFKDVYWKSDHYGEQFHFPSKAEFIRKSL